MGSMFRACRDNGLISRSDAMRLNEQTNGFLFEMIPKGSYTRNKSGVNFVETEEVIEEYLGTKELTPMEMKEEVDKYEQIKEKFKRPLEAKLPLENYEILESMSFIKDDKAHLMMKSRALDVLAQKALLIDVFGNEVETDLNKAVASYEDKYASWTLEDWVFTLKEIRGEGGLAQLGYTIDGLLKGEKCKELSPCEVNMIQFITSLLMAKKPRKDTYNDLQRFVF